MRLVVLNDLHASDTARNARVASHKVWDVLEDVVEDILEHKPDRVLLLGDLIQNKSVPSDVELLRHILKVLSPLRETSIFAMGNHESRDLGTEMTQILLREQGFDESLFGLHEFTDMNLVWLSTVQEGKHEERSDFLPQDQVGWLKETLPALRKPTLLCAHHGLLPQRLIGNFYFEHGKYDRMTIQNWKEVAPLLEQCEHVPLIVQGHAHWLSLSLMHSMPVLTLPAFSENLYWEGQDILPAHYTLIESDEEMIHVRIYSGEFVSASFEVPLRSS